MAQDTHTNIIEVPIHWIEVEQGGYKTKMIDTHTLFVNLNEQINKFVEPVQNPNMVNLMERLEENKDE